MLISLSSYLVSIWTRHCNVSTKNLLSPVCANSSYHLFSAVSINADYPMAGQNREQGGLWTKQRKERGGSDPPGELRGGAMRQGVWRKIMETQLSPRCKINNIIKAHWDGLRGSHIIRGG